MHHLVQQPLNNLFYPRHCTDQWYHSLTMVFQLSAWKVRGGRQTAWKEHIPEHQAQLLHPLPSCVTWGKSICLSELHPKWIRMVFMRSKWSCRQSFWSILNAWYIFAMVDIVNIVVVEIPFKLILFWLKFYSSFKILFTYYIISLQLTTNQFKLAWGGRGAVNPYACIN